MCHIHSWTTKVIPHCILLLIWQAGASQPSRVNGPIFSLLCTHTVHTVMSYVILILRGQTVYSVHTVMSYVVICDSNFACSKMYTRANPVQCSMYGYSLNSGVAVI